MKSFLKWLLQKSLYWLSPEDIDYPTQLAVQNKFTLTAIETVIINKDGHVLLLKRPNSPPEIPQWRGKPHSPGSMLRSSDKSYDDAFQRVQNSEIKAQFKGTPQHVASRVLKTDRGTENAEIHICKLAEEPKSGWWCDPGDLPLDLLSHHYEIISIAVEAYKKF